LVFFFLGWAFEIHVNGLFFSILAHAWWVNWIESGLVHFVLLAVTNVQVLGSPVLVNCHCSWPPQRFNNNQSIVYQFACPWVKLISIQIEGS
jgi:hypothetical protein